MSIAQQDFAVLTSYFKTLSVGPAGVELTVSRMITVWSRYDKLDHLSYVCIGQIVITEACGGHKLRTDLQFHEGTLNKMVSQIPKPEYG